ncbi:MAG: SDR family NAD(P)-dependent oxidoreductase [Myxococcota bacterium]
MSDYDTVDPSTLTVFVTGATAGFGAAVARRFVALGARVIATGRREERLRALRDELGDRLLGVAFDVRDAEAVREAVDGLPEEFAAVDVLVNNAGLALGLERAHETDPDDWEAMVDTNVKGLLYATRALLPGMVERRRGHVINLGSIAANWPYPGANVYGATKAFVHQFSLNLRADLVGHPVRVTDIQPGLAETEFSVVRFKGDAEAARKPYEGIQPLRPDDVAEAIRWVATLPRHVNVNTLEVMPTMQSFAGFALHRGERG